MPKASTSKKAYFPYDRRGTVATRTAKFVGRSIGRNAWRGRQEYIRNLRANRPTPDNKPLWKRMAGSAIEGGLTTLGGLGGGYLGGVAGNAVASLGKRILGLGDYTITQNSLMAASPTGIPEMHGDGQTIVVRHKEYLGDVFSSSTARAFSTRTYKINPGNSETFPWLSQLATNFSEYELRGMVYYFKSNSGDAFTSTDNSTGSVMMCTQYRSNASVPDNKQEMLQQYWSNSAKPQEDFMHAIECDPAENPFKIKYVRATTSSSGDTELFYNHGQTTIGTVGFQGTNVNCGELWVTYEIAFKKPIQRALETPKMNYFHATATAPGSITTAQPTLGGFTTLLSTIGTVDFNADGVTVTLPRGLSGRYNVQYTIRGTSTASVRAPVITIVTNINNVNGYINNTSSNIRTDGTGTKSEALGLWMIDIVDPNVRAVLQFNTGGGVLPTTPTDADLYIVQVPDLDVSYQ